MKRCLSLFLTLVLVMGVFVSVPVTVNAENVDYLTFELNKDGTGYILTECYEYTSGDVVVPDTYNGLPVTSLENTSFYYCRKVTSIKIPASVTLIREGSFLGCFSLENITVDSANEYYCTVDGVLYNKDKTTLICHPAGKKSTSYNIPDSVTSIATDGFLGCESLASVKLPEGLENIGYRAFCDTGLTSIKIPDSVTTIETNAFRNTKITSIEIPSGVYFQDGSIVDECANLVNINVDPENEYYTSVDGVLFSKDKTSIVKYPAAKSATKYVIPDGVKKIESGAFRDCKNLVSLEIPDGLTEIDYLAFENSVKLTEIAIPGSVTTIGSDAFYNTGAYNDKNNWDNGVFYIGDRLIKADMYISGAYTIREGTKFISDNAFYLCDKLTSIIIPDSITSISDEAFAYCSNLASVTIPDSVKHIGVHTFAGCTSLNAIAIPDSVTSIGESAFYETGYYNNADNWEDGVLYIGNYLVHAKRTISGDYSVKEGTTCLADRAFTNCRKLVSVKIPDGVIRIGDCAFMDCYELASIGIPKTVTIIGEAAFFNTGIRYVFYKGTEQDWSNITIEENNSALIRRDIHYNTTDHTYGDLIIDEATCSVDGVKYKVCSVCNYVNVIETINSAGHNWKNDFCDVCGFYKNESIASQHPYEDNTDQSWTIYREGAERISVTFSTKTKTERYCDYIYIYDGNNNLYGVYSGTALAGVTCMVDDDTIIIRLTSDGSQTYYGFEITKIESEAGCVHNWENDSSNSVSATCTEPGLNVVKCSICGDTIETEIPSTGHTSSDWIIDTNATTNYAGSKHKECTECGEVLETAVVSQLKPATPKLTKVANTASGVQVTWGAVDGADDYIVYRRAYNASTKKWGGWSRLASGVTSTSYLDKTAKTGTYYRYTVKATNEAGTSGYNTSGLKTYFLAIPKATTTNSNSGVTVKWGKVAGATGYIVYRKTGNGKWTNLGKTTSTSFTDKTAKSGVTYRYTVKAYYSSYVSAYNTNGYAVRRLLAPTLKNVSSAKAGVTFKWNKVTGATGYIVYRKTGNGGWQKLATVTGNSKVSYLDKTAKKGVTYTYTVRAYYGTSTSYYNTKGLSIKDKY